ncbi:hypothetical protein MMC29_001154 [Sticta canariensis]|nr:hypothetical protein [Sticta canariensis]
MGIIRREHLLPSDWPTKEEIELLVEKSGGLFIYAVTVCRFIRDHRWFRAKRLEIVLEGGSHEQSPKRRLDELYIQILENSIFQNNCNEKEKDLLSRRFQNIVGSFIVLFDSLSVIVLTSLFPTLSETIEITLAPLKSLLDVPVNRDTPVRLLHPSFRDFLLNQGRCQARRFWIDQRKAHHDVAEQLWNPVRGNLLSTLRGHSGYIGVVVFSPDGQILASGSMDKTVKLWGPVTRDLLNTLEGHLDEIFAVAFSPDSQLLAAGSGDFTVKLWDPVTGFLRGTLEGHSNKVSTVAFSPDGQLLASGAWDETVRLWDPVTRNLLSVLESRSAWVWEVAFSPDSQLLAAECEDNTIRLWLVEKKRLFQRIQHEKGEDLVLRNSRNLAFSTDGSQLLLDGKLIEFQLPDSLTLSRQKRAATDTRCPLNIERDWVTWNNRRVLWLPSNQRPGVYVIKNNIVAIGNGSGRMNFFSYGTI